MVRQCSLIQPAPSRGPMFESISAIVSSAETSLLCLMVLVSISAIEPQQYTVFDALELLGPYFIVQSAGFSSFPKLWGLLSRYPVPEESFEWLYPWTRLLNKTPLHLAVLYNHTSVVKVLLENGADSEVTDSNTDTPLLWAAMKGHTPMVEVLINNGADVNAVNKDQNTPLHKAAKKGYAPILEMLLNNDANVNAVNKEAIPSINIAAYHKEDSDCGTIDLNDTKAVDAINRLYAGRLQCISGH
uniref:Ankyrin-1-like n=1 Tax=Saccoglossus kowalevskii TaxID=10224 RepID=A0ABM0LYI7_SACKO|nr:PREDICTED: ankyrin-1-like [Saccoglossus kowalevskii]